MSAADKVAEVNAFNRANVVTLSATGAFLVINGGKIVLHLDSTVRTGLLTLAAAYTAIQTYLAHLRASVVAGAFNDYGRGIVNKMNNIVWTLLSAKAAADTLLRIDLRYTTLLVYGDSVSRTNPDTVAVSKAGKGAESVTGVIHISSSAGLYTLVAIFTLLGSAGAVAGNVGYLLHHVTGGKAHNFTDLTGNAVATGNTQRRIIGGAVTQRLRIAVTAGEAACAAVRAGQAVADHTDPLILFDTKENGGKSQKHSAQQRYSSKSNNRN